MGKKSYFFCSYSHFLFTFDSIYFQSEHTIRPLLLTNKQTKIHKLPSRHPLPGLHSRQMGR